MLLALRLGVPLTLGVGLLVSTDVPYVLPVRLTLAHADCVRGEGEEVTLPLPEAEGEAVWLRVTLPLRDTLGLLELRGETEEDTVSVPQKVCEVVTEEEGETVGDLGEEMLGVGTLE